MARVIIAILMVFVVLMAILFFLIVFLSVALFFFSGKAKEKNGKDALIASGDGTEPLKD